MKQDTFIIEWRYHISCATSYGGGHYGHVTPNEGRVLRCGSEAVTERSSWQKQQCAQSGFVLSQCRPNLNGMPLFCVIQSLLPKYGSKRTSGDRQNKGMRSYLREMPHMRKLGLAKAS